MNKKNFYVFGILLLLTTLSDSRVVIPREVQNSENGEIPYSLNPLRSANKPSFNPEILSAGDDFGIYEYDNGPFDYDNERPGEFDKKEVDGIPKVIPEKFPSDIDRTEEPVKDIDEKGDGIFNSIPDTDKLDDDGLYEPFDDDSKDSVGESDSKPVEDDDKSIPKDEDESHIDTDVNHEEDDSVKSKHNGDEEDKYVPEENDRVPEGEDEDKDGPKDDESEEHDKDESEKHGNEDKNSEEHDNDDDASEEPDKDDASEEPDKDDASEEPDESEEHNKDESEKHESEENDKTDDESDAHDDDDDDDEHTHATEDAEPFSGGSIFDTPLFNYERVKKYFGLLDKALGHAFQETMDEAKLLNGTYTNTTEEEVDIDGKKYVVQKSVIKSADNHSTIYVETLSTKPKMIDTEEIKDTELKNVTNV